MLDQLRDIVQGEPWLEIAKITRRYLKRLPLAGHPPARQPPASVSLTISRKGRPARRDSALSLAATSSSKVSVVRMSWTRHHDVEEARRRRHPGSETEGSHIAGSRN